MTNFEISQLVLARIVSQLLENGLSESVLTFEDLELESDYEGFFSTSAKWLADEGLIRWQNSTEYKNSIMRIWDPVLTAKGMAWVGQTITIEGKELTVGEGLKAASDANANPAAWGDFFGGVLGGLTKSFGNG